MSIICTDGVTIAADGQTTYDDAIVLKAKPKMKVKHGRIYAVVGLTGMLDVLADWHNVGAPPDKMPPKANFAMLVCDGKMIVELSEDAPYPVEVSLPWAIGAGWQIAYGIMLAGRSPKHAVEMLAKTHIRVGGEVKVENIAEALGLAPPSLVSGRQQVSRIDHATGKRKIRLEETAA